MDLQHLKDTRFKRALAGLDLTVMDDHVIRYAAMICQVMSIEKMFFVHVEQSLELPEKVLKEYPDLLAPLDESIKGDLQKKINRYFANVPDTEVIIEVKEGNPIDKILRLTVIKEIDLILMGRKISLKGSGIASSRIARKSPCSLLLIPEDPPEVIDNILVPSDFSEHSALALAYAERIAENTQAKVSCINVYKVPSGYHTTGRSHQEFAAIMEKHASNDYKDFLKKYQLKEDTPCHFMLNDDGDPSRFLYQHSTSAGINLILIGSRGRTSAAVMLIGSLAEKLTYMDRSIPLLIIKEKGENMSFIEALMRI
ncbi:universal stress protein [Fulvivirga sp. M361]|uniref:universal stress protein n=1 Tax=Fulvivirga sp. M361 TaxID=2594266 RepID=UPI00117A55C7|nr:universal stress protein [Fulvivirga sp. M361]TRX60677.1 universal stress protein [Fulvivirga sp. M361]